MHDPLRRLAALGLCACGPTIELPASSSGTGTDDGAASTGLPAATSTSISSSSGADGGADTAVGDDAGGTASRGGDGTTGSATTTGPMSDFITPNDVDGPLACDTFLQDCPRGHKCMPWADDGGSSWNATRCSPIAGRPGQEGDPCFVEGSGVSGIDDCDLGLMCWNVDETGQGWCENLCSGTIDSPVCPPSEICVIANNGVIALCRLACDPLVQDCPIESEICTWSQASWICAPHSQSCCSYGEPCSNPQDCGAGHACVGASAFSSCAGTSCCTWLCDHTDGSADATCEALDPVQRCEPWYAEGQAPIGYEHVGACVVP